MMVFLHRGGPTGEVGISAGDLEIGQVVHLNESGVPIDYLVVHQAYRTIYMMHRVREHGCCGRTSVRWDHGIPAM